MAGFPVNAALLSSFEVLSSWFHLRKVKGQRPTKFVGLSKKSLRVLAKSVFSCEKSLRELAKVVASSEESLRHSVKNVVTGEKRTNKWINRTLIHLDVGSVSLWWGNSSGSLAGCISACYPFR